MILMITHLNGDSSLIEPNRVRFVNNVLHITYLDMQTVLTTDKAISLDTIKYFEIRPSSGQRLNSNTSTI